MSSAISSASDGGNSLRPTCVARQVDAGLDQQAPQPDVDPRRRADALAFDYADVTARGAEILVHHQEPVHALALRAEELGALPLRERGERRMRRPADEVDRAV